MAGAQGRNGIVAGWLPVAIAAALFAFFVSLAPEVAAGRAPAVSWDWLPSLGIAFGFRVDGLALTFALLISGIGALVLLYSNAYLAGHPQYARFALFLTSFMLAMLGLVLAADLIALFVFWELTTITSYLLIGFIHEDPKSRRNALQALFVTGGGALAMLAGFILIGMAAGTFDIAAINAAGLQAHPWYGAILVLMLIGAFTKSAQVPLHFWLPNAMAAPTPVSAFLHSATMVKGGVYLLARLHPSLSGTEAWLWSLTLFGGATAVFASLQAMRQTDLKQALAYTTLMALGTLVLLLGQSTGYALTAFAAFLVVHSLYKAALFLVVGCVDHETGTRQVGVLGGLLRPMPATALAAALAALSMAGIPPLLGFIAKEIAYASAAQSFAPLLVAATLLAANVLMVAVAGVVAIGPFWQRARGPLPKAPHEAPWAMLAGPLLLAALGLGLGLLPGPVQTYLVDPVVLGALGPGAVPAELKLWAGVNLALVLSGVTLALGIAVWLARGAARRALERALGALPSLDAGWDGFMDGLKAFAVWQTRIIQGGRLRVYMATMFVVVAAAVGGSMLLRGALPAWPDLSDVTPQNVVLLGLIGAGSVLAAFTGSRILAMAALGVTGIGVAMTFIVFSAPDVAITQLLVETLIVVLVAVALLRLPQLDPTGRPSFRPWDAALAAAVGIGTTLVLLAVLQQPLDLSLTAFFEAASYPEAFGRNIVNVILVDFRALDTFGEIAVVVIAALSSYALLRTTAPVWGRGPGGTRR
ncbi:multisubunit sodium/proton antiporter MrpA subunit [Hasllibacter halocynthiae]|uniref:Multisubunit sodium/proton antiporter MrpA subunit n=1 Tax=Hasllibacter halocynthiae TaxID=595589 RepID=A0A2T0X2J5_9RHOB|nr:hydrogen gas-evolving membrane-bound hydrogenase subunit E [Hasllibacter halocynthiae]PRY93115.1 multisubunit sodium/proton antiporter MrpA subunit [Hasllibacter halocynthiae]